MSTSKKTSMFYVLESNNRGWKVVWSKNGEKPEGGELKGNWLIIQDGMKRDEAILFCNRLNA